jgi:hypothetical protein
MNRRFTIFYNTFSVLRLAAALVILSIIVIEAIKRPPPVNDGSGWDLFSPLEELCIISFVIAYPVNSIINALITFRPRWTLPGIFSWKPLFILCYIVELYSVPWFLYKAWERVQDAFFPPTPNTYLDTLLGFLKTEPDRSGEKWSAVALCLLVISSLLFIVFFWKVYRTRRREIVVVSE